MNLKRHHVLYVLLAICLIFALLVFLTPVATHMSDTSGIASSSLATQDTNATSSIQAPAATSTRAVAEEVKAIHFEIVTTQAAQEKGLGGRVSIPENYAMLFVFPKDEPIGFWMKDMLVPIDMLWLSDSGTILGIEDSVAPNTYPKAFYPPQPVKYVLETKAGEARRRGWKIGTRVQLPLPYRS